MSKKPAVRSKADIPVRLCAGTARTDRSVCLTLSPEHLAGGFALAMRVSSRFARTLHGEIREMQDGGEMGNAECGMHKGQTGGGTSGCVRKAVCAVR